MLPLRPSRDNSPQEESGFQNTLSDMSNSQRRRPVTSNPAIRAPVRKAVDGRTVL